MKLTRRVVIILFKYAGTYEQLDYTGGDRKLITTDKNIFDRQTVSASCPSMLVTRGLSGGKINAYLITLAR